MAPFVRRERKHKRLARHAQTPKPSINDTNAVEIIPSVATSEREARRQLLAKEIRDQQGEASISSKKRKRLDKYIDTKLRKEETAELLSKLASQKTDTSLLRSSKQLGRKKESKRESLARALNEKDVLGLQKDAEEILFEPRPSLVDDDDESGDSSEDEGIDSQNALSQLPDAGESSAMLGSGLKRPLATDENGYPIIQQRKRRKQSHLPSTGFFDLSDGEISEGAEDEEGWQGFSDSDKNVPSSPEASSELSSDDSEDIAPPSTGSEKKTRSSAFKIWADAQRNSAVGFTPSSASTNDIIVDANIKANFKPRAPSPDPLLEIVQSTNPKPAAITITRPEVIQQARLELPVVQEEQKIIETINANPLTIICGATGSGKTTQVPQMLFENGYGSHVGGISAEHSRQSRGMIGITQPRRVAATSVAGRVAFELGDEYSERVAHQVRFDTSVRKHTSIKFMTDGILLREIQSDFPLTKYSCIIIDEAHERSVNTDILIGMLSRIVPLRAKLATEKPEEFYPLKLVIMSATLRVNDFLQNERLFQDVKPPVVDVEGRQYAVTEHFARRTKRDYVGEMIEKVARGHRKLPPGGMLVFLTGQEEIWTVARRLKERLGSSDMVGLGFMRNGSTIDDFEDVMNNSKDEEYIEDEDNQDDNDSDAEIRISNETEDEFVIQDEGSSFPTPKGVIEPHILPLYAALPASQQQKVFQPPPEGHRSIILATNVAETSLTIPNIRYVFDSGRAKEKRCDQRTGIETFEVDWISKASAAQRKGRAGRTGPGGHVWRLYSSAIYEQYFDEHTVPEILRTSLESVVLQLKGLEIQNVANFPYPTTPEPTQLLKAETLLRNLGAIGADSILDRGKEMQKYPVNPRFGRILALAKIHSVASHAVAIVAGLAVGNLYVPELQSARDPDGGSADQDDEAGNDDRHKKYSRAQATLSKWDHESDAIKILTAVAVHADALSKGSKASQEICKDFWLQEKSMNEIQELRKQLHSRAQYQGDAATKEFRAGLSVPSDKEIGTLKQIVAAGFIDQVAIRADLLQDEQVSLKRKARRAIEVAYRTLVPTVTDAEVDRSATAEERNMQKSVFVHPSSVLARLSAGEMPDYLVYSHLSRAAYDPGEGQPKRTRMHPLTAIRPKALAVLAEGSPLLEYGRLLGKIEELPNQRRQCWVEVALRAPGSTGWPLCSWKVIQKKDSRGNWNVEKVIAR